MSAALPTNFCTTKGGLTGISGAATTFSTGVLIDFTLAGKAFSKAAVTGGATPTTDFVTGLAIALTANNGCVVAWCLDAGGNVRCIKGETNPLDGVGNFVTAPEFPELPDTVAPFAYTLHKAGSTTVGTWTFGSSNWNASGLTHVVVDIMFLPRRPQVS